MVIGISRVNIRKFNGLQMATNRELVRKLEAKVKVWHQAMS